MIEAIVIVAILFLFYLVYTPLKKMYHGYYKNKNIKIFEDMCDNLELNMNIEDSLKIYKNKLEERFTIELHRHNLHTDIMDPLPIVKLLDEVDKSLKLDKHLKNEILKLSQQGFVEEFFYGKHPFLPIEKIYIGFSQRQNFGYLLEKDKDKYVKRIYINTIDINFKDIFPHEIADKLKQVIPYQILMPKHIYKYEEGHTKPMSCYIGINRKYNVGNIWEVLNNILKIFNTKKKTIDEANSFLEPYKKNSCYWLGLTNKKGTYFATIYYTKKFEN